MAMVYDGRGPIKTKVVHFASTPTMALCGGRVYALNDEADEVTCKNCIRELRLIELERVSGVELRD